MQPGCRVVMSPAGEHAVEDRAVSDARRCGAEADAASGQSRLLKKPVTLPRAASSAQSVSYRQSRSAPRRASFLSSVVVGLQLFGIVWLRVLFRKKYSL